MQHRAESVWKLGIRVPNTLLVYRWTDSWTEEGRVNMSRCGFSLVTLK